MPNGQCPLGNIGFPVVVSGLSTVQTKPQPNDLDLRFGPPLKLRLGQNGFIDLQGSHTFFLQGDLYTLINLRICKPTYSGQEDGSETRVAELQFWGAPPANSATTEAQLAVLIVPIYEADNHSKEAKVLLDDLFAPGKGSSTQLADLLPDKQIVLRYNTCVELLNKTYRNIAVAYWRKGIAWNRSERFIRNANLTQGGVPLWLIGYTGIPNTLKENPDGTKTLGNQLIIGDNISVPYTKNIQADSTDYDTRFRQMLFERTKAPPPSSLKVGDYKCIAVDRSKDILNGRIRLNPKTGETMDSLENTLEEEKSQQVDLSTAGLPESKYKAKDIEDTVGIVLGIVLGLFFLALVFIGFQRLSARKTDSELLKNTMAAAAAATVFKIDWIDLLLPFFLGITTLCLLTVLIIILLVNK